MGDEACSGLIEKDLEREWDFLTSNMSIVDFLFSNEIKFLEDGTPA
jgi:hypothetical protein